MHVRQTPSRLVVRYHPKLAVFVALFFALLAAVAGTLITTLGKGPVQELALIATALLLLVGAVVLVTEPRAKMWIFDRRTQQVLVVRQGWLGAVRPEATSDLGKLASAMRVAESTQVASLRRLDGRRERLFEGDFHWATDRQRALHLVRTFLIGEPHDTHATSPAISPSTSRV